MDIDEIREKLKDRNLMVVAENIGIHYNTIYRIVNKLGTPNYKTLKLLSDYLGTAHG